jgi:hypothetical protein
LTHHAHQGCAAVDHIEFTRGSMAHVDDAATAIRTTVCYAHDDRLAVVMVGMANEGLQVIISK